MPVWVGITKQKSTN